jgi:hypothetical protein
VLDEAMAGLGDDDREAVLLRYFKNQDFQTVGLALGVSDTAAQKRVSRAIERLRKFFAKRGVTVGTSRLVVVISANAVQAAPVGLATTISTAAALGGTTTATALKTIAMTVTQKVLVTTVLAAAVGTGINQARQASIFRNRVGALQQQQTALTEQVSRDRDEGARQVTALKAENDRLNRIAEELPKLRGEVTFLRRNNADLSAARTNNLAKTPANREAPEAIYAAISRRSRRASRRRRCATRCVRTRLR